MQSILIDTHAFLWFVFDDPRLSERAEQIMSDPGPVKVFSIVSLWEIAVKVNIEKLRLGMSYSDFLSSCVESRELELLEIRLDHLTKYVHLPLHHRDPFDRILIAQAKVEGLPVLSSDTRFSDYGVDTVW
jgi:PIN domain nuclease of toxin-antitoxin system